MNLPNYKNFTKSRISNKLSKIFLEAKLPLAGQFLSKSEIGTDETYPLSLSFCEETSSIQVNESIKPEVLFKKYFYKTGSISTLVNHLNSSSSKIIQTLNPKRVLDLGCNDFTFLKNFVGVCDRVLGVDPSDISKDAKPNDIDFENEFFSLECSEMIKAKHGEFDVIFSSNNFAHIEDIRDYTAGISNLLSDNGTFVCEVHWVGTVISKMQFPFIYHEHLYYYTLKSLKYLLNLYGLYINDVESIDIHGGSIRIFASKKQYTNGNVDLFFKNEDTIGLYNFKTYEKFAQDINLLKNKSKETFKNLKSENKIVYGYGASGQANTLMSFFELGNEDLACIIDDSPVKCGLYTPRNHIPIKNRKFLIENLPNSVYVLAYTFMNEIRKKNSDIPVEWISAI